MKTIGVYAIVNLTTGQRYIGSSVNISARWSDHLTRLRKGTHHCATLQQAWSFFGAEAFGWQILEVLVSRGDRVAAEQRWLDDTPSAYNAARRAGGGPRDGFRHTVESKAKMSAANRAAWQFRSRILTPEHKLKVGLAGIGRIKSAEARAKTSATLQGRSITWGDKIGASLKGVPYSAERKAKHRAAGVARGLAISLSRQGQPWSAARRAAWLANKVS